MSALLAGGLVGPNAPTIAQAAAPDAPAPTGATAAEADALAAARRLGRSVEVRDMKSETTRVLATPKGSFVLESYGAPRWTKGRDGAWRSIDTSLRTAPDGSVAPVATLAEVSFSAGGSSPAVRLPVDGGQVSLTWQGALPAPRLEGDSAVYESVLPGVDLRLRALTDGFTWVLVVKSAEAAANPALAELRFGLSTSGALAKRARVGGGFEVVDGSGRPVASAGSALMWDSSGLTVPAVAAKNQALAAVAGQEKRHVVRSAPDLARKAELSTTVQGEDLVIRPDLALLRGKGTTYPVMIDPWTTINKARWGYAGSENATRDDGIARVGLDPSGGGTFRSYFAFSLSSLAGRTIRSAKFLTEMTHSWSCTSTPVNLWRTADLPSNGKQSWSGPSFQLWLEERSGHAHKPSGGAGCSDDPQPDLPMEFSSTNLKNDVSAYRGDGNYTLALSTRQSDGTSESTSSWWKKFDPAQTKLSVEYNTNPNTPTTLQLATHADYTAQAQPCATGSSRPTVRSFNPWFKATLTDPDGSNGGSLSGTFALQKLVSGTTWTTVSGWPVTDSGVAPGAKAEVKLNPSAVNGDVYRWQVQTKDTLGGASGWSPWCEVGIDNTAPAATPKVTSADGLYLESPPLGTNQNMQGSAGYSGRFTFSANGVPDVYEYVYQIKGGPEMVVQAPTLGGSAIVWVTPYEVGQNILTVRSRDQAGNASGLYEYVFLADNYSAAKSHWAMDEGSGTSLTNQAATGPTATLTNGPTWTDSRLIGTDKNNHKDWAVKFDGSNDYAPAATSVIDTSKSYSVAAWVRPDADGWMTVAVAPGNRSSAMFLRRWHDNSWALTITGQDSDSPTMAHMTGSTGPTGAWTHVAASYDAGTRTMSLYVNGQPAGSLGVPATFTATGPFTIGREHWKGIDQGYWKGLISEVRVWDRVIDPDSDLASLVTPREPIGEWAMDDWDEEVPRQAQDASDYRRPVTLTDSPSTQWCEGTTFLPAVCFDGISGTATSATPVVRTDASFTVSAWVKLSAMPTADVKAVAQDGANSSGFSLGARNISGSYYWAFLMKDSDLYTAKSRYAKTSTALSSADIGKDIHLVGVYDAQNFELRLYVNGERKETVKREVSAGVPVVPWQANGAFTVARDQYNAVPGGWFNGAISRVGVWSRAMTDADVNGLFNSA